MKNKKGFTLIELLAVIVILAVIALIATPVVMNSIEEARKGSAKNAGFGVVKAIEHDISLQILADSSWQVEGNECRYNYRESGYTHTSPMFADPVPNCSTDPAFHNDVDIQGTRPNVVDLNFANNEITDGFMCINNYPLEVDEDGVVTNYEGTTTICDN